MAIKIQEDIGIYCITLNDGQSIYSRVLPELKAHREVELDFSGVRIIASPFMNAAVGQLLRDFTPEDLNKYLKITSLSAVARPILKKVIENAKEYYSSDAMRMAVDNAIEREASSVHAD